MRHASGAKRHAPAGPAGQATLRFYVAATYAQMAETTVAGQLSLWTWDGRYRPTAFRQARYLYNFGGIKAASAWTAM